jgi:hypothetical protein
MFESCRDRQFDKLRQFVGKNSIFALVCGAVGSLLMRQFFDIFVIAASAVSGAAMVLIRANHILPGVRLIDRPLAAFCPR